MRHIDTGIDLDSQPFLLLDAKNRPTWNEYKRVADRYEKTYRSSLSPVSPYLPAANPAQQFAASFITERNRKFDRDQKRRRSSVLSGNKDDQEITEITVTEAVSGLSRRGSNHENPRFLVRKAKLRVDVASSNKHQAREQERAVETDLVPLSPGLSTSAVDPSDGSAAPDMSWTTCFHPIPLFDFFLLPENQRTDASTTPTSESDTGSTESLTEAKKTIKRKEVRLFMRVNPSSSPTSGAPNVLFPTFRASSKNITSNLVRASNAQRRKSLELQDQDAFEFVEEEIEDFDGLLEGFPDVSTHLVRRRSSVVSNKTTSASDLGSNKSLSQSELVLADADGSFKVPPGVNIRPRRRKSAVLSPAYKDAAREAAERHEARVKASIEVLSEEDDDTTLIDAAREVLHVRQQVVARRERMVNEPDPIHVLLLRCLFVVVLIWASLWAFGWALDAGFGDAIGNGGWVGKELNYKAVGDGRVPGLGGSGAQIVLGGVSRNGGVESLYSTRKWAHKI